MCILQLLNETTCAAIASTAPVSPYLRPLADENDRLSAIYTLSLHHVGPHSGSVVIHLLDRDAYLRMVETKCLVGGVCSAAEARC